MTVPGDQENPLSPGPGADGKFPVRGPRWFDGKPSPGQDRQLRQLRDLKECRELLVIKPSSLGDLVHTLPTVHLLKRAYPQCRITWLVHPAFASLLEDNPDVDATLLFPRESFRGASGLVRFGQWLATLRHRIQPDVAIDFQGLMRSGLVAMASGAKIRIGFSDSREGARLFHNHVVRVDARAHAIDRSLSLAACLNLRGPVVFPLPMGTPPAFLAGNPGGSCATMAGAAPVVLHPFSRGEGKSLTLSQIEALCRLLEPLPVWLVGQTAERHSGAWPGHVVDLSNRTTIPELLWVLRQARGVISVDSGPMHMAAAVTPHVLGLHTWSDPRKVGPWHPGTSVWKAGRIFSMQDLDPVACGKCMPLPDQALPEIAAWAHGLHPGIRSSPNP